MKLPKKRKQTQTRLEYTEARVEAFLFGGGLSLDDWFLEEAFESSLGDGVLVSCRLKDGRVMDWMIDTPEFEDAIAAYLQARGVPIRPPAR